MKSPSYACRGRPLPQQSRPPIEKITKKVRKSASYPGSKVDGKREKKKKTEICTRSRVDSHKKEKISKRKVGTTSKKTLKKGEVHLRRLDQKDRKLTKKTVE